MKTHIQGIRYDLQWDFHEHNTYNQFFRIKWSAENKRQFTLDCFYTQRIEAFLKESLTNKAVPQWGDNANSKTKKT